MLTAAVLASAEDLEALQLCLSDMNETRKEAVHNTTADTLLHH